MADMEAGACIRSAQSRVVAAYSNGAGRASNLQQCTVGKIAPLLVQQLNRRHVTQISVRVSLRLFSLTLLTISKADTLV